MSEALLLWARSACLVADGLCILGMLIGLMLVAYGYMPPFWEERRRVGRCGAWILAVCIVLLIVLPWPSLWNYWLKLVRMP